MARHDTQESFHDGESFTFKIGRKAYVARIEHDTHHGAPWKENDGHGNVTEWTGRDKAPGELVLCEDRGAKRFYDFAGACRIARRDGWGFLPGKLICERNNHHGARKFRAYVEGKPELRAYGKCQNTATAALYALHSASMTPRQYAAQAARADYEYLRKWCADQWFYVGVIVAREGDDDGREASLWGIENTAGDYIKDVARELAAELKG